jgi:hypothetical protein
MKPSHTPLAAPESDPRLDLVRGIANWSILLDHIPHNAVNLLTLRNFGFSGSLDLFVFVAGYATAHLYGRMMQERGFVVTSTRIFRRVWQVYAAYVVLFVLYVDAIGYVATQFSADAIIDEYNLTGMIDHSVQTLAHGLTLQTRVLHLDGLQLFIVLLASLPLILPAMLRRPKLTLAASVALYVLARLFDWGLAAYPDGRWLLNPFCWQLLFVLGVWFALDGARYLRAIEGAAWLRIAALAVLAFALAAKVAGHVPQLGGLLPDFGLDTLAPIDRENLAFHRVVHFLALALVFIWLVPADWRGLRWKALQPLMLCGRQWLPAFCAGVFLSFAGHFVLINSPDSIAWQALVSVTGLLAMTAVAYYVSWSKRPDHLVTVGAKA